MSQGMFSIGGIASGLDTTDMINQLMQLERQPVTRLEQRQDELESTKDAWGQLTTRLSSLRSATDGLRRTDRFDDLVALDSSDPDAVAISRGTGAVDHSELSFTVEQLATRMQRSSADRFAGLDAALDGRELTITDADGIAHDLTADLGADATLSDLVTAINDAGIGVEASALQVTPGEHQLVLTAEDTGIDASFDVTSSGWGNEFAVTQDAQDAHLKVGGIDIFRGSNTVDDLVEGATLQLNRTTDTAVTVSAERDVDGAVEAVTGFVEEINKAIDTIGELTSFDPESKKSGPLQGQFAASQLAFDLRSAITQPIAGLEGPESLASSIGLSVDRNGTVQVDEAALRQAFTDDFDGTAARFARTGSSSDPEAADQVGGSRDTVAGTYAVEITRAATVARATGSSYTPPGDGQPKYFTVQAPGGGLVQIEIDTSVDTASKAAAKIQQALEDAGATSLTAGTDGDRLTLESTRVGSGGTFEVYETDAAGEPLTDGGDVWGLQGLHEGLDVQGTIDGQAATGAGGTLTAEEGPAAGLSVFTTEDLTLADGDTHTFDVNFWHGIGAAMDSQLLKTEGSTGSIARARSSIDSQMSIYQDRIDAYEERLESREETLRRQFVAMETAMDRFNSQGQWLQGQLAQLGGQAG
ncbi:MAG: flagellar filament capping protein FliD [Nitriliruptoraceae bacterium]